MEQNSNIEEISLSLVGNKLDLEEDREVKTDEAKNFAIGHDVPTFLIQMLFQETSAKNALNVDVMMENMVKAVFERGIKCGTRALRLSDKSSKKA